MSDITTFFVCLLTQISNILRFLNPPNHIKMKKSHEKTGKRGRYSYRNQSGKIRYSCMVRHETYFLKNRIFLFANKPLFQAFSAPTTSLKNYLQSIIFKAPSFCYTLGTFLSGGSNNRCIVLTLAEVINKLVSTPGGIVAHTRKNHGKLRNVATNVTR